jgi:DNA helicase-2/ATP-dependent DNA helicase PcrA
MTSLLDTLNPAQREAVLHGEEPLLVLAGAGSGKTRVLTHRIARLVADGLAAPHEITAVTFTNKAAREMQERVERLVGEPLAGGFVGTFHRWALDVLRRWPREAGLAGRFGILDRDDQRAMVTRVTKDLGLDVREWPARVLLGRISSETNRGRSADALEARAHDPGAEVVARVWRAYDRAKRDAGAVDFDDMLRLTLDLVRRDDRVRAATGRRAGWLLVDEFQDTNLLQMSLLKEVLGTTGRITAVGDEDQSIYRWRGAELDNILSFERHFPGARTVALERNYRSTSPILDVSGRLIARNTMRRGKRLYTDTEGGDSVRLYVGVDERAEARWISDRLDELRADLPWGEMAVLVRTNAQTRAFEEELTRRRTPHRVIGGLRFWQRAEVKDALAYLRLVVNPDDVLAFERVVNVPARGIGAATLDALRHHADSIGRPLPQAARELPENLSKRARLALEEFNRMVDEARDQRDELDPADHVGWLLERTGLLALYDGDDEERTVRRENLQQLASAVAEATERGQSLEELLDAVALLEDTDEDTGQDAVSLMTLHAAKGLEFDAVVLAGLEDGLLPHASSRDEPDGLEEERRLAYVGMTRARRWLALTAARSRFLFGQRTVTRLSRFLEEVGTDALDDVSDAAVESEWSRPSVGEPRAATTHTSRGASRRSDRRPIRPTVTDADGTGWRPGDRVAHRRFGTGVVLACQGRGPQLKLVVYFDRGGRKTLVPTIAKLEKV